MKKLIICFLALVVASSTIAQAKRVSTKKTTPTTQVNHNDSEFPAALNLTPEQHEKIRKIDEEIANRMNSSERTPDKQAQMEEKMKMYRLEKIRNILTPEQQVVFDEKDKYENKNAKSVPHKLSSLSLSDIHKLVQLSEEQQSELKSALGEIEQQMEKSAENADDMNKLNTEKTEILRKILTSEQLEKLNEHLK